MRPVFVYRVGGLLPVEEISNSNSVWFDSLSAEFLADDLFGMHEPRSTSVYASVSEEEAWSWAERNVFKGQDATIYSIQLDDPDMVNMYRFSHYDEAIYLRDALQSGCGNPADGFSVQQHVDAYWNSAVPVSHVDYFLNSLDSDDAELHYSGWEIKIPAAMAAHSDWEVECSHELVLEYWGRKGVTPHMFDDAQAASA